MATRWVSLKEGFELAQAQLGPDAEKYMRTYLRHGEIEAFAERLTRYQTMDIQMSGPFKGKPSLKDSIASRKKPPRVRAGSTAEEHQVAQLDAQFWASAALDFMSSCATVKDWTGKIQLEAHGIMLRRDDLARLWPPISTSNAPPAKRKKLGRKPKYDWPAAQEYLETLRRENRLPPLQADVERRVLDWFGEPSPVESEVRKFVRKFLDN